MVRITFKGASQEVGRSAFLVDDGDKILLDYGVKLTRLIFFGFYLFGKTVLLFSIEKNNVEFIIMVTKMTSSPA